jgi:hypothetical protein
MARKSNAAGGTRLFKITPFGVMRQSLNGSTESIAWDEILSVEMLYEHVPNPAADNRDESISGSAGGITFSDSASFRPYTPRTTRYALFAKDGRFFRFNSHMPGRRRFIQALIEHSSTTTVISAPN